MKIQTRKKSKLFKKKVLFILFFLVTFFAFSNNLNAAYFNYSDFDFDEFAEENKSYWTGQCVSETVKEQEKCVELILSKQRIFYTRLYKILAKYQKKGYTIDDNVIIATVFYDLTPDLFTDEAVHYKDVIGSDSKAYNYADLDNYDVEGDGDFDSLSKETDTLELLIRNMFSYNSVCYGISGNVTKVQLNDGSYEDTCLNGGYPTSIDGAYLCAEAADKKEVSFVEYLSHKLGVTGFFRINNEPKKYCDSLAVKYPNGTKYQPADKKTYSLDSYWNFLEKGEYFDNKAHLRNYFETVLKKTNKKTMKDLTETEYQDNLEEITDIRKRIIKNIKSIIEMHGESNTPQNLSNINNSQYWWPVGGSEITKNSSGKDFAMGDPLSLIITSSFGNRLDPFSGNRAFHTGLDIGAPVGTPIIAARDGIVELVVNNCSTGTNSCGGGYGNYVILSHGDGNYTLYAHLNDNSVVVSQNESVEQGQILGLMGSTGNSTGSHLHFEVRVGSNESSATVDPLTYISAEEPRKNSTGSSDLMKMLVCMEGKGPDDGGNNYKVYDDAGNGKGTLTVGAGITLKNHVERFAKRGIDISKYNYAGALIPKEIVDDIKLEVLAGIYDSINTKLSNEGISLLNYQVDALVSRQYNVGNVGGFPSKYKTYGNTQGLYDNYMSEPVTGVGFSGPVLKSRRDREWKLFHQGIYHTC